MANLTAVLACLVLVITKGTVECCKLSKLVALELVLSFWDRSSLKVLIVIVIEMNRRLTVSMTLWINFFALLTFSSVSAMIKQ